MKWGFRLKHFSMQLISFCYGIWIRSVSISRRIYYMCAEGETVTSAYERPLRILDEM
jgi:hypothetical protein